MHREASTKRKLIASIHALVLLALALTMALASQFASRAWFSTNDTVDANGIAVSAMRAEMFEEVHYYRGTETRLITENGEKYNRYYFSYNVDALNFTVPDENGNPVRERTSFSDSIPMLEHSDLSANSQVLIRIKMDAPGTYAVALNTSTTDYLGALLAAKTPNGPYDIAPSDLPLSSVVHFAILNSTVVSNDATAQMLSLSDKDLGSADHKFITLTGGVGSFAKPFDKLTVTVGEDCYLYIFVDYYLPAIEDVVEKTLLYVDKALAADATYDDIIVGHTNLVFATDFELVVEEVAE